jgi:ribonuclease Z
VKLVLLGTTGYHPSERQHTACFMLPEIGVVLDAGSAMFRVRDWLCTPTLDIFLTHAHLDHVLGLTFLFDVLFQKTMQRVTVHGEAQKLAALQTHLFAEELFPASPPFQWQLLANEVPLADGGRLTHFPVEHPGGAVGFRLDWPDRSLAYVTDTTARPDAAYVEKIRGVDLLLHECNFPDEAAEWAIKTGHSWTTNVALMAREANVGHLIAVHVNPLDNIPDPIGIDKLRAIFPNAELGFDGQVVEF